MSTIPLLPSVAGHKRGLLVAVTVAIGSFIQGWAYILLTGHPSYMEEEFNFECEPVRDALVWVVAMIGMVLAMVSGRVGGVGRRPLLLICSMFYLFSSVVMIWSNDVSLILISRFLDGFAWGFSYILLIFYFMETAPWGLLRFLLPQLATLCGVCLCFMVAEVPLGNFLGWRFVLDAAFVLSLVYFILAVFILPESPKWLAGKGRIDEARQVMQILSGSKDVSDDMASSVYGLRLRASSTEDYDAEELKNGPQDLSSDNLGNPMNLSTASQKGSIQSQNVTLTDSLLNHSGKGNVDEDSLTREGEDSTSNADASVLTIRVDN